VDLSVNVEYSLALAAIFFFFVSRKLTLLSLAYKQEKRREEKRKRAEQSRAESVIHSFFWSLIQEDTVSRVHYYSVRFCTSRLSIQLQQCSAVVSVVFSGVSPDRGKETTFKLMRLAVSCSCPSHKILKFGCFRQPPSRKGSTGDWGGYYWDYYYKSMGIMQ
jgi:hypothetical protein